MRMAASVIVIINLLLNSKYIIHIKLIRAYGWVMPYVSLSTIVVFGILVLSNATKRMQLSVKAANHNFK